MAVLLLNLSAPMQSWGTHWKLHEHPTDAYPSKSAVIGMIASSEGRKRDADISDLAKMPFGVRVDKKGKILCDFQIAIKRSSIFQDARDVPDKYKYVGNRYFLSDAKFTVALQGEKEDLEDILYNLNHPANALFCGRRGFPVNADLTLGVFDEDIETALHSHGYQKGMRIFTEVSSDGDRMVRDNPISFDFRKRQWSYRMIKES